MAGICDLLQTTPDHIRWLVKQGYIEIIPGRNKSRAESRYLDPTPQYAERLRLAEVIYRRRHPLPAVLDLPEKAIFTAREVAELMGWTHAYTVQRLHKDKLFGVKVGGGSGGGLRLYTAKDIRRMIAKRQKRAQGEKRCPVLLRDLITFFQRYQDAGDMPSDADFSKDDVLGKKITRILNMPASRREEAMRELMEKARLAKEAVSAIPSGPK